MNDDQISVRMVVLLLVGALTVAVAFYRPSERRSVSASSLSPCSTS
ncbi:hypothetical protein AB0D59_47230 [Streptomyces sp. NPDC048417]